jgi:DNA polymerase
MTMTLPGMTATDFPPGAIGGPVEAQLPEGAFSGLALVAEAPGRDEVIGGRPLVGDAGRRFDRALEAAGVDRATCLVANPFRYRPEKNRIGCFFATRRRAANEGLKINTDFWPAPAGYVIRPHDADVRHLWDLLRQYKPAAIVALGNTAMWALTGRAGGVTKLAGEWQPTEVCQAQVMVTYHPSFIGRKHDTALEAAWTDHIRKAWHLARG